MKQPKALVLLNFVSMWECFSYYGMRVLLVLFMIQALGYTDNAAFGLYALYTALVELSGVAGGIVADRWLGLKRSIVLGGWIIVAGHLCLAIPDYQSAFFLGLALVVVGTGLFRSNAAMLLGQYYEENDPRRDAGYTLYYTGINIGGFLATLCCGLVGEVYGWHAGFSLAALGMLMGNLALFLGRKILGERGTLPTSKGWSEVGKVLGIGFAAPLVALALYYDTFTFMLIPLMVTAGIYYAFKQTKSFSPKEKSNVYRLAVYVGLLILFYACEEQLGSSLLLFAERHVDRETGFGVIPAASLIMFNPLTILITGPLLSQLLKRYLLSDVTMMAVSFFLLGTAFCLLYVGCLTFLSVKGVHLAYIVGSFFLIALGELCMGPTVYSYASKIAPENSQGFIMGIVTMGFALANLLSGWISGTMVMIDGMSSLEGYSGAFGWIGLCSMVLSLGMLVKKRFYYDKC